MADLKPDWRGFYRCPHRCGNPDYPQRKWKTLKGIEGHLEECPLKPPPAEQPKPPEEKRWFADCSVCGDIIWTDQTIWCKGQAVMCLHHHKDHPGGFMDFAGLELGDYTLEG